MPKRSTFWLAPLALAVSACEVDPQVSSIPEPAPNPAPELAIAPGAPGALPTWSNAQKFGIGSSYEAYDADGQFTAGSPTAPISKVWFSIGEDRITEVMWGLIHEAQLREMRFVVIGPDGPITSEHSEIVPHINEDGYPVAPAPTIVSIGPDFQLRQTVFTDPDRDTLIVDVDFTSDRSDLRLFALIDPALANTGSNDRADIHDDSLHAHEDDSHLVVMSSGFDDHARTVGFVGASDGIADLQDGQLDAAYETTGDGAGNVAMLMEVPLTEMVVGSMSGQVSIGFGASYEAAKLNAEAGIKQPADLVLTKYVSGWTDYLSSLTDLPSLATAAQDGGALAYMSAINLKIMEDKSHAGALIASLSNPWGETAPATQPQTGYKAVWPRDFFQVASAFLAMGDAETALAAYRYLPTIQVRDDTPGNAGVTGWFLQKTHVDGEIEWVAIQQDQTAMPIMLGWKLWRAGVISDAEIAHSYRNMLKPAADFLVEGGRPNILWNTEFEASLGYTQQERWEEQEGYSPSTIAAVISGLITAADLAERFGDPTDAETYLNAADYLESNLENWMFTTNGALGDGEYFIRITRNQNPNDKALLGDNNGRPGLPEDQIVDGGFLELVRYGVRAWDAPSILSSLAELDGEHEDNLRVRYVFENQHLGWRRYGNDGYGEDGERGTNYHEIQGGNTPGQRGRVWPFFSGERGHYEIAKLETLMTQLGPVHPVLVRAEQDVERLIASMEAFANVGLSLPEQVWDGVGPNPFGYELGEGTNSATPLAWTHAEYIKLLRSYVDRSVWDRYPVVEDRFATAAAD